MEYVDRILINGSIYTVDDKKSIAKAVALKGSKIIYVGDSRSALQYRGENTEVINLDGGMVLPGFVDAHMHPLMSADVYMKQVTLFDF